MGRSSGHPDDKGGGDRFSQEVHWCLTKELLIS